MRLAAEASCDARSARKALELGPETLRGAQLRERITKAAKRLGLALGSKTTADQTDG